MKKSPSSFIPAAVLCVILVMTTWHSFNSNVQDWSTFQAGWSVVLSLKKSSLRERTSCISCSSCAQRMEVSC